MRKVLHLIILFFTLTVVSLAQDAGQNPPPMHMRGDAASPDLPSPHASSGTASATCVCTRSDVDALPCRLELDGAWNDFCDLQPAGRPARGRQSRVGKLPDDDGAAPPRPWYSAVAPDVLSRVTDVPASRLSRTISDWRDLSRGTSRRSSAPPQCLRGIGRTLYRSHQQENFLAALRRPIRRARAGPGDLSSSRFGFRKPCRAPKPSSAGFHAHEFRSGHDRLRHFEIQTGRVRL